MGLLINPGLFPSPVKVAVPFRVSEMKNGLDPNNPVDGNTKTKDPNGQYTNLEVYLNSLVQHIVDAQNK